MLYVIEVDVQTDTEIPEAALDGLVRERLRGVTAHVPGGAATVTHCKRLTSGLLNLTWDVATKSRLDATT